MAGNFTAVIRLGGTANAVLQIGDSLYRTCGQFLDHDVSLAQAARRLQHVCLRLSRQVEQGWPLDQALQDEKYLAYEGILDVTAAKLQGARKRLVALGKLVRDIQEALHRAAASSAPPPPPFSIARRLALLQEAIADVELWHKIYRLSQVLAIGAPDQAPERHSGSFLFPTVRVFRNLAFAPVPMSDFRVATIAEREYLVDVVLYNPRGGTVSQDLQHFARKLDAGEEDLVGLLSCKGYVAADMNEHQVQFAFLLLLPKGFGKPYSLRATLMSSKEPSTSEILQIGQDIAAAVGMVHNYGLVHKNIKPETIVLRKDQKTGKVSAFLAGFGKLRLDLRENRKPDFYCHPDTHGNTAEALYVMQNDIYSLGVLLLEIGLWKSFVGAARDPPESPTPPSPWLQQWVDEASGVPQNRRVKSGLMRLAEERLPQRMGCLYADVVKLCLTCLDAPDVNQEDRIPRANKELVGAHYVEKVLIPLHSIRM
ncbi:HET-s domain [Cordyceps militaris]|uniref:HET-s domain n=1 Tax=Cordyceps militaris TaxID=73501 RepID=A0A2H4SS92_CORMI|nr:HET-s domain [Cordyceps militaris]